MIRPRLRLGHGPSETRERGEAAACHEQGHNTLRHSPVYALGMAPAHAAARNRSARSEVTPRPQRDRQVANSLHLDLHARVNGAYEPRRAARGNGDFAAIIEQGAAMVG